MTQEVRLTHWAQVMRERNESGASIRAWCREKGINEKTYYYWQRRLREAACRHLSLHKTNADQTAQLPQRFAELRVTDMPGPSGKGITSALQIEVGTIRINVDTTYSPEQLGALLRAITQTC